MGIYWVYQSPFKGLQHKEGPPSQGVFPPFSFPRFKVTVKVMLYIMSLVSVDQKEQQMEVHGFYRTQWLDQRLAFSKHFEAGKTFFRNPTKGKGGNFCLPKCRNPKTQFFQTKLSFFGSFTFCFLLFFELFVGNCCLHDSVRGQDMLILKGFALNKCRCFAHTFDGEMQIRRSPPWDVQIVGYSLSTQLVNRGFLFSIFLLHCVFSCSFL